MLGVVTDGDFRRGILKGIDLDAPVTKIMAKSNTTAFYKEERRTLLNIMRKKHIRHLPLLDEQGVVAELLTLFDFFEKKLVKEFDVCLTDERSIDICVLLFIFLREAVVTISPLSRKTSLITIPTP